MKPQLLTLAASLIVVTSLHAESPVPVKEAPQEASAVEIKPAEPAKPADLPPPKPLGDPVTKGLAWLAKAQNSDGGWGQGGGWRINVQNQETKGRVEGAN